MLWRWPTPSFSTARHSDGAGAEFYAQYPTYELYFQCPWRWPDSKKPPHLQSNCAIAARSFILICRNVCIMHLPNANSSKDVHKCSTMHLHILCVCCALHVTSLSFLSAPAVLHQLVFLCETNSGFIMCASIPLRLYVLLFSFFLLSQSHTHIVNVRAYHCQSCVTENVGKWENVESKYAPHRRQTTQALVRPTSQTLWQPQYKRKNTNVCRSISRQLIGTRFGNILHNFSD